MADQLDKAVIAKAYARWAPVYDFVFGAVFERGRKAAVAAAERIGGRILEVGVGTGLSLPDYSVRTRLIGVDLSAPMLRKAKARVWQRRLGNVDGLAVMDAQHLAFAEGSFDVVVAQYVITAVPDPEATLDEFARVIRPGGEIVLVNHLGAETGLRAVFEKSFAPVARRFPVPRALRRGGAAAPRSLPGIAGQPAIAVRHLAAGTDADANASGVVDAAGYTERRVVIIDPAVRNAQRIAVGAIAKYRGR